MSGNTERDESGQFESELGNEDIVSYHGLKGVAFPP